MTHLEYLSARQKHILMTNRVCRIPKFRELSYSNCLSLVNFSFHLPGNAKTDRSEVLCAFLKITSIWAFWIEAFLQFGFRNCEYTNHPNIFLDYIDRSEVLCAFLKIASLWAFWIRAFSQFEAGNWYYTNQPEIYFSTHFEVKEIQGVWRFGSELRLSNGLFFRVVGQPGFCFRGAELKNY